MAEYSPERLIGCKMNATAVEVKDELSQGFDTMQYKNLTFFATNALPEFVKETILMGQFTLACVIYAKILLFHCFSRTSSRTQSHRMSHSTH